MSSAHGGVAIYLRSNIPFTIVSKSVQPPPPNTAEHLFLEIILCHTKVLLGVYYSPNLTINYFPSFETLLEDLSPSYSHSIIMGDFNTCLIKDDSRARRLKSIINSSNMRLLPLNATHHFPNCNPSLLDLMIVSSVNHVARHGQYCADAFSYHDLIFLSYKIRPPKPKPKILMQRNFSGMDADLLREDAARTDWSVIDGVDTVDEKLEVFNSLLTQLYDAHAPIRAVKLKHLPAPWLTDEIRLLQEKKNRAKSKYKVDPSDMNRDRYHAARNRCNTVCRDAQRRHIHQSVKDGDPAKVWKFLRSMGVGKPRSDTIPKDLNTDSLNQHFSSSSSVDSVTKIDTLKQLSSKPAPDISPFCFDQFTDCDVKKSILTISSNAVGSDCISRKMIIPLIDLLTPVITKILNFSIYSSSFPQCWKEAEIIPLPKKSNPATFSDYRPISILPFLSKVLERLVHWQLSYFLSENHLLNPFQSGFRPGHSTTTALVKISDDIRHGMEKRQLTVLTLLDFSNAFNTVDFDILLGVLTSLNISPTVVDWFHSYLCGRRQRVKIDDSFSNWCDTTAGVPQGGVLSPLLFATFINSITHQLSSSCHLYADDLQIYSQATYDNLAQAISVINADLERIMTWSKSFGLRVNPGKTQCIIIGSPSYIFRIDFDQLPSVMFDGINIPFSKTVKNLGIHFDSTLSWDHQVAEVSRKMFAASGSLRRLRNFLPTATKIALAQALLLPILDYADVSYPDLTVEQLNKFERIQNLCIRFIFGLRKYDHVSEYRNKLKWLPIRRRRDAHILSLLYSVLFNPKAPSYLKERFQFISSSHGRTLRSNESLTLLVPSHSSKFYDQSFTNQATRLWNCLPVSVRTAESVESFRKRVKDHYLTL